ncbi:hypothetical protein TeGR_g12162, partial [Tetraparma gracilis]
MKQPSPALMFPGFLCLFFLLGPYYSPVLLLASSVLFLLLSHVIDNPPPPSLQPSPSTPSLVDSDDDVPQCTYIRLSGTLLKRGGLRLSTWQSRHFTLSSESMSWSESSGKGTIGCIPLASHIKVSAVNKIVGGEKYCFQVVDGTRSDAKAVREFACASEQERDMWVSELESAISSEGLRKSELEEEEHEKKQEQKEQTEQKEQQEEGPQATTESLSPAAEKLISATPGAAGSHAILSRAFPQRHPDELARFACAKPSPPASADAVTAFFQNHLTWEAEQPTTPPPYTDKFPKAVYAKGGIAKDGSSVFFTQGAIFDPNGGGTELYARHAAEVMKSIYPNPSDMHQTSFFLDIRTDKSFFNPKGFALLPLFK